MSAWRNRSFAAGFVLGMAAMAGIDEIVFHQLLGWHHFSDNATPAIGLLSDGLLHAAELFALAAGFFLLLDASRRDELWPAAAGAGLLVGLGTFQLFDGVVDHKILRVHQIRYDVDLLPYDVAWIGGAIVLLVAGLIVTAVLGRRAGAAPHRRR